MLRIPANKPAILIWIEPDYLHMKPQHVTNTRPVEMAQTPEASEQNSQTWTAKITKSFN